MPRKQYQAPTAPTGQAYGEHQDSIQAQKAIPLPQGGRPPSPAPAGAPPAGAPAGQPPMDPMQAAIGYARDFQPGITPLNVPSQRPGEPVTAGLSQGPGAGPDAFDQPSRAMHAADFLTKLGQASGNTDFLEYAGRIRGAGGMR